MEELFPIPPKFSICGLPCTTQPLLRFIETLVPEPVPWQIVRKDDTKQLQEVLSNVAHVPDWLAHDNDNCGEPHIPTDRRHVYCIEKLLSDLQALSVIDVFNGGPYQWDAPFVDAAKYFGHNDFTRQGAFSGSLCPYESATRGGGKERTSSAGSTDDVFPWPESVPQRRRSLRGSFSEDDGTPTGMPLTRLASYPGSGSELEVISEIEGDFWGDSADENDKD